jgi:hypothetical protein
LVAALWISVAADAQPRSGSIVGTVQRPDGSIVADAPVRATDALS